MMQESQKMINERKQTHVEKGVPYEILDVANKTKLCMETLQKNKVMQGGHIVFEMDEERAKSELRFSKQNKRNMRVRPKSSCVNP